MVERSSLLAVAVIAWGMAVTPGPAAIHLIFRSVAEGRRDGLVRLGGAGLGHVVHLSTAVLGLAALFRTVPELFPAFKAVGAAYLTFLAWRAIRPGGTPPFAAATAVAVQVARDRPDGGRGLQLGTRPATAPTRPLAAGLAVHLLNPWGPIMYAVLLPQFIDAAAGKVALQAATLGGTYILVSLLAHACLVVAADPAARLIGRKPSWLRALRYVIGGVLAAFAIELAVGAAAGIG